MKKKIFPWIYLIVIAVFIWSSAIWQWRVYYSLAQHITEARLMQWFYKFSLIAAVIYFLSQIIVLKLKHIAPLKRLVLSFICLGTIGGLAFFLHPAEKIDLVQFLIVGFLAGLVINSRYFPTEKSFFIVYIIALITIPVINEGIQWLLLPGIRFGSIKDIITGITAILSGLLLSSAWSKTWLIGKFRGMSK